MNYRTLKSFLHYDSLYRSGNFFQLTSSDEGVFFLLLRSAARKECLQYIALQAGINIEGINTTQVLPALYTASLSTDSLRQSILELYQQERQKRKEAEKHLLAELYKLRVFDWGGIHQNDINRYIVDNFVKKIIRYDELVSRIETEVLVSLKGFTLCSWYNNWTTIIIEDLFKDHHRVLPTVGQMKMVDFFVDDIPFDLKMTNFPTGYMEEQRAARGLVRKEIAALKKIARTYKIPFDKTRVDNDLREDIIAALSESSLSEVQEEYQAFVAYRQNIIADTMTDPRELLRWLYENQGTQRFDTSNRLFLILIDQQRMEDSWKLKRDYILLKEHINAYLDVRSSTKEDLRVDWTVDGKAYISYGLCCMNKRCGSEQAVFCGCETTETHLPPPQLERL